ncbi:MAG: carboxypeptidase regulatory-like domain-containing protein, partial [Candidatus Diapherotrites archaeon]|nr:carboxypeptidase regulatory-like domain-containing protein [Candidatus Diapherotrites archaeon]
MALRDAYYSLEDKYYGAIEWLDKKGVSLYPLVDALEKKNIPSFPVMLLVLALILVGLFIAFSGFLTPQVAITFAVSDGETGVPVQGAAVSATVNGVEFKGNTDSNGKALMNLPLGEASVAVKKAGYEDFGKSIIVEAAKEEAVELSKGVQMLSRTVQLLKAGTSELVDDEVTIRFSCSSTEAADYSETETTSNGSIDLQVPSNCGSLIAQPVSGQTIVQGVISDIATNSSPQLFLSSALENSGSVNVNVEDAQGNALGGITVQLYKSDGTIGSSAPTASSGTAALANVPTGTYYVVASDPQGRFALYDGSGVSPPVLKQLQKDATITFDVVMQAASAGKIKVTVKDSTSQQGVNNATVYLKKNNATLDNETTNASGYAEFNVPDSTAYSLEVDADGYLIATVTGVTASATSNTIYLERASADNTQTLEVNVLDSRQRPIDGVRVVLKKADGTIYANDKVTGVDGKALFTALPLDTYFVYAVKKGFEGQNSDPITIVARQQNKLTITLPIGFGNIEAVVLNDEMQPVQGAIVEVINIVTGEKEVEGLTSLDGKYPFNLRADKRVYLKIDAEGFLPYYSVAMTPDPGSTVTKTITLEKDPGQLDVKLLGFYNGDEKVPDTMELGPGEKYTARIVLLVGKRSTFDEVGLHFRTGEAIEGKTNIMEEDPLYIKEVIASTPNILKGTSFTPQKGYAIDSTHLTTGDAKWANVVWKNKQPGAYAVEAEVVVKESVVVGQILDVWYRGWGKAGSYIRTPTDATLSSAENVADKQALYANAKHAKASAGPTNLCDSSFCKSFSIEDTAKNLRVSVVGQYPATIGGNYKLFFTISSTAEQAFTNSVIEFGSKSDGLRFRNYSVTDAVGVKREGVADKYSFSAPIGDLKRESYVFGSVEFKAEKEGNNILTIVIKSNNTAVLTETINVKVAAAMQLQLDVIPKEIIPFIDNQLLVKVSDENSQPVSNAIVRILLNGTLLNSTESNADGIVEYRLLAPAAGSKLVIEAEKTGFKPAKMETTIDSSILTVTPPSISEKLDASLNEIEKQVWLNNQTVAELTITKLRFSDFQDLVDFSWDDDYTNYKIASNADLNVFLTIKLSEKGMLVKKPVKLQGTLTITTQAAGTQNSFMQNIPVEIRIGLGGEVDDSKCLEIDPTSWDLVTDSSGNKSAEFTLTNKCTASNNSIALRNLQAKVILKNEDEKGKFSLSSEDLEGAKAITLDQNYKTLAEVLPADFAGAIRIEFAPDSNIESAEGTPTIEFKATNVT